MGKVIGDSTWRTLFLRRLLELHPHNHEYHFELGQALKESTEYVEALSWLQKCLAYRNVHCHLDIEAADECYNELATILRGMDFDEGATLVETEIMLRYMLRMREDAHGSTHRKTVLARLRLADNLHAQYKLCKEEEFVYVE